MRRIFVYSLVGLFGLLCGVGIGLKVSEKDPWEVIRRYRKWREDPQSYKPAGPPGLYVAEEPEDIRPSLAALVAKGELIHLDLVFPNVPRSSEVTMYWLQQCHETEGIVETWGNPEYAEFKTCGPQPLHVNLWFTKEATDEVKELIAAMESFADKERKPYAQVTEDKTPTGP